MGYEEGEASLRLYVDLPDGKYNPNGRSDPNPNIGNLDRDLFSPVGKSVMKPPSSMTHAFPNRFSQHQFRFTPTPAAQFESHSTTALISAAEIVPEKLADIQLVKSKFGRGCLDIPHRTSPSAGSPDDIPDTTGIGAIHASQSDDNIPDPAYLYVMYNPQPVESLDHVAKTDHSKDDDPPNALALAALYQTDADNDRKVGQSESSEDGLNMNVLAALYLPEPKTSRGQSPLSANITQAGQSDIQSSDDNGPNPNILATLYWSQVVQSSGRSAKSLEDDILDGTSLIALFAPEGQARRTPSSQPKRRFSWADFANLDEKLFDFSGDEREDQEDF